MKLNFAPGLARVLVFEGGKSDNPKDPGGRTDQGVTQRTYDTWRAAHKLALRSVYLMENDERDDIYLTGYWVPAHCDELPPGLDLVVFDAAVNSGPANAIKWLQSAVGVAIDGDFGEHTREAVMNACHGEHDTDSVIKQFCSLRLGSLQRLSDWPTFGTGWTARVASGQEIALEWETAGYALKSSADVGPAPVDAAAAGGNKKAVVAPSTIMKETVAPITAQIGTIATIAASGAAQAIETLAPAYAALPYLKYGLLGLVGVFSAATLIVMIQRHANNSAALGTRAAVVPEPDQVRADIASAGLPLRT